ncbi:MAG TPA: membrane dipeptidase [Acidimicrobiales bacterium]|nr:membrane dipeptidase [Acidimicrobiales bacterium]
MAASEVVDIHSESFVWTRVFGYDLGAPHGRGVLGARLYSQADLPRMRAGGMTGAVVSVATNPFRRRGRRPPRLAANVDRLVGALAADPDVEVVADLAAYRRVRAAGRFPCFVAVQGANAVGAAGELPPVVSRVTLVHLTRSVLGSPSAPLGGDRGLTAAGRRFVAECNGRRVIVDLAHASPRTFWDALAVHDRSLPPIVSHTGVSGVHPSWRNVDDDQVRAVADRGGVVGIMYHRGFLGGSTSEAVLRHLEHVVNVGGEGAAALGSDWDGMIVTPRDMPTAADLPVLVAGMLRRGWPLPRIRAVLGANYLRVVGDVRP